MLFVLSILGPGFITANVDNDSGGIYTYAAAGSQFGYSLLWTIIPVAVCLTFAQEISARMGVATGKGLSELIRVWDQNHLLPDVGAGFVQYRGCRFGVRRRCKQHGAVWNQQVCFCANCSRVGVATGGACRLQEA